jgi:hypothetical protein
MRYTVWMQTSDGRIEELRRLYKEGYGKEISVAEAREIADRLLALYQVLKQPLPVETGKQPPEQPTPAQIAP